MAIHPTALVEPGASVDPAAEVGPFSVVGPRVSIGPGTKLLAGVVVVGRVTLGARNVVHPNSVIGGAPQVLGDSGHDACVAIGDDNLIGPGVTINGGTAEGDGVTLLGNRNRIDAHAHVAHDCVIEDGCVLGRMVLLGGHVRVESGAVVEGWAGLHQFVTVGRASRVRAGSRVARDVPPYMVVGGLRSLHVLGVCEAGLCRRGAGQDLVRALRRAHETLWGSDLPRPEALRSVETELGQLPEVRALLDFLRASRAGRMGRRRDPQHGGARWSCHPRNH